MRSIFNLINSLLLQSTFCRFAYVDFANSDAKVIAITMSEKNLDGRRLLIKDGKRFALRFALYVLIFVEAMTSMAVQNLPVPRLP